MTALLLGGLGLAFSRPATADAVSVTLDVERCADVRAGEVRRLFELELGTSIRAAIQSRTASDAADSAPVSDAAVRIECRDRQAAVRVTDGLTGKELLRRLPLDGDSRGRERLLALAAAELLVASWSELTTQTDAPVPRAAPQAAERASARALVLRRQRPRSPRGNTAQLIGGGFARDHGLAFGAGARVTAGLASRFGFTVDALASRGIDDTDLGTVEVDALSTALALHVRFDRDRAFLRGGIGARAELVQLTGRPTSDSGARGDRVTGVAFGPLARATAGLAGASGWVVEASLETGWHLAPVRGLVEDDSATAVQSAWLGATLGAGWQW